MTNPKDNSGPAFPGFTSPESLVTDYQPYPGMTIRQWYAGMAMMGMNANPDISNAMAKTNLKPCDIRKLIASSSFIQADDMIKEGQE